MDASLLRSREAFHKRALALPVVENKRKKTEVESRKETPKPKPTISLLIESISATTKQKRQAPGFSALAKIVQHLKKLHHQGDHEPLALEQILADLEQPVAAETIRWLEAEALRNNPKIEMKDGKYKFKPPFDIRGRKGLLRTLERQKGMGVWMEDVQESLPNSEKVLKALNDAVIIITRPIDKKKVLFYNDKSVIPPLDEAFQMLWRQVAVESIDENTIEAYLRKAGISHMQDTCVKVAVNIYKKPVKTPRKRAPRKLDNEHLSDVLITYT